MDSPEEQNSNSMKEKLSVMIKNESEKPNGDAQKIDDLKAVSVLLDELLNPGSLLEEQFKLPEQLLNEIKNETDNVNQEDSINKDEPEIIIFEWTENTYPEDPSKDIKNPDEGTAFDQMINTIFDDMKFLDPFGFFEEGETEKKVDEANDLNSDQLGNFYSEHKKTDDDNGKGEINIYKWEYGNETDGMQVNIWTYNKETESEETKNIDQVEKK